MRIAVDAMGGDFAPKEMVQGALLALKQDRRIELMLVDLPRKGIWSAHRLRRRKRR